METGNLLGYSGIDLLRMAFAAMVGILFLQSGLDKIIHWKGEKTYLTGHFEKSPLKGMVPLLLPVITLIELLAGLFSAAGFVQLLFKQGGTQIGFLGMSFGAEALIMLFFGQRMAKDYAGAAALAPYFLLCAAGMWVFMG